MTAATPAKSRDRPPGSARRPLRANATGDDDLVVRIADGDEQAFALLYDRYAAKLLSFCRYLLGSRDEAQDAVQQTFMRAHQALKAGKLPDDVRPWL